MTNTEHTIYTLCTKYRLCTKDLLQVPVCGSAQGKCNTPGTGSHGTQHTLAAHSTALPCPITIQKHTGSAGPQDAQRAKLFFIMSSTHSVYPTHITRSTLPWKYFHSEIKPRCDAHTAPQKGTCNTT